MDMEMPRLDFPGATLISACSPISTWLLARTLVSPANRALQLPRDRGRSRTRNDAESPVRRGKTRLRLIFDLAGFSGWILHVVLSLAFSVSK
jgi:hypothetical protein